MTRYQKVHWHHDIPDEPTILLSEIDDTGTETRKIEVYRDGHRDYADNAHATGTTMLSETTMPSLEEINDQNEFTAIAISAAEFAAEWRGTNT
jgi:Domain of unknown function (DUF6881)